MADTDLSREAALRRRHRHEHQGALREVLANARGLTLEETQAVRVSALDARGLAVPPGPRLEAAAVD